MAVGNMGRSFFNDPGGSCSAMLTPSAGGKKKKVKQGSTKGGEGEREGGDQTFSEDERSSVAFQEAAFEAGYCSASQPKC